MFEPLKIEVKEFMEREAGDCDTATKLAEAAIAHFNAPESWWEETHWVWDLAFSVMYPED